MFCNFVIAIGVWGEVTLASLESARAIPTMHPSGLRHLFAHGVGDHYAGPKGSIVAKKLGLADG